MGYSLSLFIRVFFIIQLSFVTFQLHGANIIGAEYYVGEDPGEGNGVSVELENGDTFSVGIKEASVALSGLEAGVYTIGMRVKDSDGNWSLPVLRRFEYTESNFELAGDLDPSLPSTQGVGVGGKGDGSFSGGGEAEYYVGEDPGEGNGVSVELENGDTFSVGIKEASVALSGLEAGVYTIGMRVKDSDGNWSLPILRRFEYYGGDIVADTIEDLEDFVDDSGASQIWSILVPDDSNNTTFTLNIGLKIISFQREEVESYIQFLNRIMDTLNNDLYVVARFEVELDDSGLIKLTHLERGFINNFNVSSKNLTVKLESRGQLSNSDKEIVGAEYFFDLDPGEGKGTEIENIQGSDFSAAFDEIVVPIWRYKSGNHRIGVRFKNAAGQWGNVVYRGLSSFTIFGEDDVTPPVISLSPDAVTEWPLGIDFEYNDVSANDLEDGDLSSNLIVDNPLDPTLEGEQIIRYVVADYAGNITRLDRKVLVSLNEPPEIVTTDFSVIEGENIVGEVIANDPNNDDLSLFIVGQDDRFIIDGSSILISENYTLDFEENPSLLVNVKVSDGKLSSFKTILISLIDDRDEDADGDGLSEAEEEDIYETSDLLADTDGDGFSDFEEVSEGSDPIKVDEYPRREITVVGSFVNKGFLSIGNNYSFKKDSTVEIVATANEGYLFEGWFGVVDDSAPAISIVMDSNKTLGVVFKEDLRDSDNDGVSNYAEVIIHFTDPQNPDTDDDGYSDGIELAAGLNPKDKTIFPNEAPVIESQTFSVLENSASGLIVGELVAQDANGDTLTFSILSSEDTDGDGVDALVLVGDKLLVLDNDDFDYEKKDNLSLTVQVKDRELTDDAEVTITIIDDRDEDADGDGLSEAEEEDIYETSDLLADTDGDGFSDFEEASEGSDPIKVDEYPTREIKITGNFDGKGSLSIGNQSSFRKDSTVEIIATPEAGYLFDAWSGDVEESTATIAVVMDSNKAIGLSFKEDLGDSDGDGVSNHAEVVIHFTDPNNADTDNDGYSDGVELTAGSDPKDKTIVPNKAPVIESQTFSVVENTAAGLNVAELVAQDEDGDILTFSILSSEDNDEDGIDAFVLVGNKLLILDKDELDYEKKDALSLTVQVKDKELTDSAEIIIRVINDRDEDTDGDGLTEAEEEDLHGTSDLLVDTDEDGFSDFEEIVEGSDPIKIDEYPTREITVTGDFDGKGSLSIGDQTTFKKGSTVEITATPEAGYLFDAWSGDVEESIATIAVVMNSNKAIGLSFKEDLGDSDEDGVSNHAEIVIHFTDPNNADTDNDGYSDGVELAAGSDPKDKTVVPNKAPIIDAQTFSVLENTAAGLIVAELVAQDENGDVLTFSIISSEDTDNDGIAAFVLVGNKLLVLDKDELDYEKKDTLNITVQVKDRELTDNAEVTITIINDRDEDTDGDGLTEAEEEDLHGTSDLLVDTDGDGFSDPEELNKGTDPKDELSFPGTPVEGDQDGDGWKDEDELLFGSLVNDPDSVPEFQLKINPIEDNEIELIFPAENESKYLIQISSDLNRWLSLRVINGKGEASREKFSILDGYGFFRVLKE